MYNIEKKYRETYPQVSATDAKRLRVPKRSLHDLRATGIRKAKGTISKRKGKERNEEAHVAPSLS